MTYNIVCNVGGMVYDEELGKGVKKRYIPASQTVTFPANASFDLVIQKSREIFFPYETNESDGCFTLADSGGVPYDVENKPDWILSNFVQGLKQPPSKLRIYVMYQPKDLVVGDNHNILLTGIILFSKEELPKDGAVDNEESDDGSSSKKSAKEKVPENIYSATSSSYSR